MLYIFSCIVQFPHLFPTNTQLPPFSTDSTGYGRYIYRGLKWFVDSCESVEVLKFYNFRSSYKKLNRIVVKLIN